MRPEIEPLGRPPARFLARANSEELIGQQRPAALTVASTRIRVQKVAGRLFRAAWALRLRLPDEYWPISGELDHRRREALGPIRAARTALSNGCGDTMGGRSRASPNGASPLDGDGAILSTIHSTAGAATGPSFPA